MSSSVRKFDTEISDILARAKANGIRKPFLVEFLPAGACDRWLSYAPGEVPAPKTYGEAEAFALANMGTGRARIAIRTHQRHAVTVAEFFPE